MAFIGQSGIGAVAIPAVLQSWRLHGPAQEPHLASPLFAPPLRPGQLVSPAYAARLARGLTVGASLEQANRDMLADALAGRQPLR